MISVLFLVSAGVPNTGTTVLRRRTRTSATEAGSRTWNLSDTDRQDLLAHLYVVLATDGSVRVHGIKEGWGKQPDTTSPTSPHGLPHSRQR